MTDSSGTATYTYDNRGRLLIFTRPIATSSYSGATTNDELDRILTQIFPNGDVLRYRYGDHGKAVDVILNTTFLVQGAAYNALLKPMSYPLGNGLTSWRPTGGSTSLMAPTRSSPSGCPTS